MEDYASYEDYEQIEGTNRVIVNWMLYQGIQDDLKVPNALSTALPITHEIFERHARTQVPFIFENVLRTHGFSYYNTGDDFNLPTEIITKPNTFIVNPLELSQFSISLKNKNYALFFSSTVHELQRVLSNGKILLTQGPITFSTSDYVLSNLSNIIPITNSDYPEKILETIVNSHPKAFNPDDWFVESWLVCVYSLVDEQVYETNLTLDQGYTETTCNPAVIRDNNEINLWDVADHGIAFANSEVRQKYIAMQSRNTRTYILTPTVNPT
jgi:hypothetical protein